VIVLRAEAFAAIDALDPVELWRLPQLQGKSYLHRRAPGPALDVPKVLAVVEDPGEEPT